MASHGELIGRFINSMLKSKTAEKGAVLEAKCGFGGRTTMPLKAVEIREKLVGAYFQQAGRQAKNYRVCAWVVTPDGLCWTVKSKGEGGVTLSSYGDGGETERVVAPDYLLLPLNNSTVVALLLRDQMARNAAKYGM